MSKDIAVCIGENGEIASMYEQSKIVVYSKSRDKWNVVKEKDFVLEKSLSIKELRKKMAHLLEFLNGCKIFVGLSIIGIPYFELEKSLFSIWEFKGKPEEILEYVLKKEEELEKEIEKEASHEENSIQYIPVEITSGCYYISIKEIQENDTGVTTKQALLPFLKKAEFHSLEVRCSHVPPWLEAEIAIGSVSGEVEKISNVETKIIITPKCC
ncbi:MAG: Fe-only nitrogenase accessory AnfO family protein [Eubacteriales bacterium]|jgi:Fe-only nitrogenase accessory protein AnfO